VDGDAAADGAEADAEAVALGTVDDADGCEGEGDAPGWPLQPDSSAIAAATAA